MSNFNILKDFADAAKASAQQKTTAYDTQAEVRRIEGDTAWVHIPSGVDETPVKLTVDAKVGDVVQVRVGGGSAWITGNQTAPPTDDTTAKKAQRTAEKAAGTATDYVLDNSNGVFVHPKNNNADGVLIRDTVQIIRSGKSVAEYGDTVRIGETDSAHIEINEKVLNFVDRYGDTSVRIGLSADGAYIYQTEYIDIESAASSYTVDYTSENGLVGVTAVHLTRGETYTTLTNWTFSSGVLTITYAFSAGDELEIDLRYQGESSYLSVGSTSGSIGDNVLSVGSNNSVNGDNAGAIGTHLTAKDGQTAVGTYNRSGAWLFAVGNGTGDSGQSDERQNAMAVYPSGFMITGDGFDTRSQPVTLTDCNNATNPLIVYYANANTTNKPSNAYFYVRVMGASSNNVFQIACGINTSVPVIFARLRKADATWTSWVRVI